MDDVLAIIMAGGQGERLSILAQERAKPALIFAGKYRIIDFTLSNCVNSGIRNVAVLTQYQPLSMIDHIGVGADWGLNPPLGEVRILHPYPAREEGRDWYKGTADAVYQNLQFVEEKNPEFVLILSGDHVYKMDYSRMLSFHKEKDADVTLAVTPFPEEELHRFGTVTADESGQVTGFQEKIKHPRSNLVSMGVYFFKTDILRTWLEEDAASITSKHDFGRNVIPRNLDKAKIFAYRFDGYWRDIGTVQSYWKTQMELLEMSSAVLFEDVWPIRTKAQPRPPTMIYGTADITNSLISDGCIIQGHVEHSVLSPGVRIGKGAVVRDSIILSDALVGRDSAIDYSILDKEVVVEPDCHIGFGDDFQANRKKPQLLNCGITLLGKRAKVGTGTRIGHNCLIYGAVDKDDFPGYEIQSGETIRHRRRRATA